MRFSSPFRLALALTLVVAAAHPISAQEHALPTRHLEYRYDSGSVSNDGTGLAVIAATTVRAQGATWLRLYFDSVELAGDPQAGTGSILRLTAYLDGAVQELNLQHVGEWQNSSAYFNGEAVEVEILAHPRTGPNRLVIGSLDAGIAEVDDKTQCGPNDDRVPSFDPRVGRAMPVGCTAWMIDDCRHCFTTAGHCCCSSVQVMEFNVPNSQANGNLVHPPPQDQYSVDTTSRQNLNGGVGSDYAHFGCFKNSGTNLWPFEAQGSWFTLAAAPPAFNPAHVIRITGYGTDSGTANQIQQTHTGPYAAFSATTVQYQVDTQGGNSGSPVIWENSPSGQVAIGVHTHGGCSTGGGGANSGTGTNHPGWDAMVANPLGVCRVLAAASIYCTGKVNSQGCTPAIAFTGLPSEGGVTSFSVNASNALNQKNGLLFYGFGAASLPFQGGILCVANPITRTTVQNSGGSGSGSDCTGTYTFDMGAYIVSGQDSALFRGVQFHMQYWMRDPNDAFTTGLSNAVQATIGP